MAASHLLRLKAVKGNGGVLAALKHNKRELQSERGAGLHIDVTKTPHNYALAGHETANKIATHAKVLMLQAGIETPRKNAVMAVEVLFSLPIDRHSQNTRPFFEDCYQWVLKHFAGEVLSFDVHLDESAPHAHALILPLVNGKMKGNIMIGGTGNLLRLINLFHQEVARHYGLSRPANKRLTFRDKATLERNVLMRLTSDSVMQSSVWPIVRDAIGKDPLPFAQLLSVDIKDPPAQAANIKDFVDYKRSKGKGYFQR